MRFLISPRSIWIVLVCLVCGAIGRSLTYAAQPATPTVAPPIATPTPEPVPTPTSTVPQMLDRLLNGDAPIETSVELFTRYPIWTVVFVGIGILFLWFVLTLLVQMGTTVVAFVNRVVIADRLQRQAERIDTAAKERAREQGTRSTLAVGIDAYLTWLQHEMHYLPQIPLDQQQQDLTLQDVYVPLRVVERAQMDQFTAYMLGEFGSSGEYRARREAFTALEQSQHVYQLLSDQDCLPPAMADAGTSVARSQRREHAARPPQMPDVCAERLLLIGDAGSGKTTTLHFGALILAQDYQQGTTEKTRTELNLFCRDQLFPIYIRLTLLLRYLLERHKNDRSPLTNTPVDLVFAWVDDDIPRQVAVPDFPPHLISERLRAGTCLVFLDGLDETGDAEERAYAKHLINNLVQACPGNRYVVASRPFEGVGQGLTGFIERRLSPLNEVEIQRLLHQWFTAVGTLEHGGRRRRRSAAQEYEELWHRLDTTPRLFDMATNPLLLTSMAVLVHGGDPLPPERAKIYHRLVSLTLVRWREAQMQAGHPPEPGDQPVRLYAEESDDDVRRRLQELAAWMVQHQRREIMLREAQDLLAPVYGRNRAWHEERSRNHVQALLRLLSLHSGLIQERDQGYSFMHFTLQEYLTARDYDERDDIDGLAHQWPESRWRETILLAVGHWATSGYPRRADHLLRILLTTNAPGALFLAAEALDEANARLVTPLGDVLNDTVAALETLAFHPAHCPDPRTRNEAATLLDRLGADQRSALDLQHPAYWAQRIEPGSFVMGDGRKQFVYAIHRPYALAHYPVTNRQYEQFLQALEDAGRHQEAAEHRPFTWPGRRYRPGEGNHPVTGISWQAATAFAAWVDAMLRTAGVLQPGEEVRLPTEPEWERAAAYPVELPTPPDARYRREYPWGTWPAAQQNGSPNDDPAAPDTLLAELLGSSPAAAQTLDHGDCPANTRESKIGDTSVVGIFPAGAADCGAEELAGNVWEWCSTPYQEYPLPADLQPETLDTFNKERTYVLRGGSWAYDRSHARCGARYSIYPLFVSDIIGVRLARLFSS